MDTHGKNVLHYAIDFGNEDLVALFLSVPTCDPNFRDRDQMTPLHLAVKRNSPNIVYILLSDEYNQQADANQINRNGQTALHMAAKDGYIDVIRVILQANLDEPCDPTVVDAQQLTAYQIAKAYQHESCAKIIDEYQQGWTKLTPPREPSGSINEHEINPILPNRAQQFRNDNIDDESSDESTTSASSRSSGQMTQSANQRSDRTFPTTSVTKPEQRSLAEMVKKNPLYADPPSTTNAPKPANQGISGIIGSIPLQPDLSKTNTSKPANQTVSGIFGSIPLQPDLSTTNTSKPANQTVSGIFGSIPLQPDLSTTNASKPANQTVSGIGGSIPSQPDLSKTNASKPANQTLSSIVHSIPLQPNDASVYKSGIRKFLLSIIRLFQLIFSFD